MDATAAARAWVDAWERGWPAHDAEPIAARYAEGAVFRSHPFREPETARAYVERVFSEEEAEPEVWFGEPIAATMRPSSTGRSSGPRAATRRLRVRRCFGSTRTGS